MRLGSNPLWLPSLQKGNIWTQTQSQREDDLKTHREKRDMWLEGCIFKPGYCQESQILLGFSFLNVPVSLLLQRSSKGMIWLFHTRCMWLEMPENVLSLREASIFTSQSLKIKEYWNFRHHTPSIEIWGSHRFYILFTFFSQHTYILRVHIQISKINRSLLRAENRGNNYIVSPRWRLFVIFEGR